MSDEQHIFETSMVADFETIEVSKKSFNYKVGEYNLLFCFPLLFGSKLCLVDIIIVEIRRGVKKHLSF